MSTPINPEFQPGFDDLWRANEDYAKSFKYSELTGRAARGLAIVPGTSHGLVKEKPEIVTALIKSFLIDQSYPITRQPIRRTNPA